MNRYSILKNEIKISPKLHLQKHGVQTYILLLGITDDECLHLHMGNKQTLSFTRFDNNPNIKLMNKKGFSEFKRLKSYYKNPNGDKFDAILMNKLLWNKLD